MKNEEETKCIERSFEVFNFFVGFDEFPIIESSSTVRIVTELYKLYNTTFDCDTYHNIMTTEKKMFFSM